MRTASELRKSLAGYMPDDQVDEIVFGAVERGEVENDESTGGLSPDMVKSLVSEISETLAAVEDETTIIAKSSRHAEIEHLDEDPDYIDVEATLNSVVRAANSTSGLLKSLVEQTGSTDGALAKGLLALGQLTEHTLGQVDSLAKSQAQMVAQLDAVAKALRVPVAPRAVTGMAKAIPHPGEIAKSANGVVEIEHAVVSVDDLVNKCLAEQGRLASADDPQAVQKSQQLATAISQLSSGVPVAKVLQTLPTVRALTAA